MSALRSLLDEMAAVDPSGMTRAELDTEVAEISDGIQRLEVMMAERVGDMAGRGDLGKLGYPSITAYLCHIAHYSSGRARRTVTRIGAKMSAPASFAAWSDGRISTDQADVLFPAANGVPDQFPEAEERLVDIIEPLSVSDTARAVEYWRQSVDGPGELSGDEQMIRRGFSLTKTIGGMRRADGWLTPAVGEAFEAAIAANMAPPTPEDNRTPRQRRHDALADLARDWLDHAATPVVGGERPHIVVHVDLDAVQGKPGGLHETENGDILPLPTIEQLACDASVSRVVFDTSSEVVDVGRKTRVIPAAIRRAVIARDRHCVWPGCNRSSRWCDVHHQIPWSQGGETVVTNLCLLCRYHHTLTHLGIRPHQEHTLSARAARRRRKRRPSG
jgi:hypothetical protein